MFALRTITKTKKDDLTDTLIHNQAIGESYNYIDREMAYGEFTEAFRRAFDRSHVADSDESADNYSKNTVGFVICRNGQEIIPIYKGKRYYIMTENGKTFEKLL